MTATLTLFDALVQPRRVAVWFLHAALFVLSGCVAFLIRFDFRIPGDMMSYLLLAAPIWVIAKSMIFRAERLDYGWWRFVSVNDVVSIGFANVAGSVVSSLLIFSLARPEFPRSIYLLDLLICFLSTCGVRMTARIMAEAAEKRDQPRSHKRILIYGAGTAGNMLLREIRSNPALLYHVCGFVDDNAGKKKATLQGVAVLGAGPALRDIVSRHDVEEVLIAAPSATGAQMKQILEYCHSAGVRCKTIPGLAQIIQGNGLASQIRDVAVEDLLGRNPIHLEEAQIHGKLHNRVVVVTGAGGSIGSELCRQIARFQPKAIIGYEISENALYHLDQEMQETFPGIMFYPEIGSIQNAERLSDVFARHQPHILYHAAAYKHVPIMEDHIFEAVENNVFGTQNVAVAAAQHGIEDFVMISSDKAVKPTNVMGATKRVAELLINSLQNGRTNYVSVRFGNVLGSNGSVIPRFKKQIAAGGPITVTHPGMERYFMTIPEAVQLVLQASAMGRGGEIFVLDMGQPVKIVDLARNLIFLCGLRPDEDVKIAFTGIRPGEKLSEEVSTFEETTVPTCHEKIRIFSGKSLPREEMKRRLSQIHRACLARNRRELIAGIARTVPDYTPSDYVLRTMEEEHPRPALALVR